MAAQIERTAATLGAPFQTAAELRADAKQEVAKVVAKVDAERRNGGLKQINRQYKSYRLAQSAKGEKATSYGAFLRRYTASIVRDVAASGRI